MQETERGSAAPRYDEEAVDNLIDSATGVARILKVMELSAEQQDYAQSAAYRVLFEQLWRAVEGVTGRNPKEIGLSH
jgi:hypothetical protein